MKGLSEETVLTKLVYQVRTLTIRLAVPSLATGSHQVPRSKVALWWLHRFLVSRCRQIRSSQTMMTKLIPKKRLSSSVGLFLTLFLCTVRALREKQLQNNIFYVHLAGNLRAHILRVHNLEAAPAEQKFQCEECSCSFRKLGSLNAHVSKFHIPVKNSSEASQVGTQNWFNGRGGGGGLVLLDTWEVAL